MMDAVVLIGILWVALVSLVSFFFFDEGTKGVQRDLITEENRNNIYCKVITK